ncbi:MAG: hypothetical protein ACXWQE_14775, partial [Bdellovibrionales bacterium]
MDSFTFEIQGVTARIHSSCPEGHETLAALERDFAAFGRGGEANIQIEICAQTPVQTGAANFPLPVFQTSVLKVCGWFNHRVCIYSGDVVAEARSSRGRRLFWISGQDRNLVREVTYKFLLSAIGEALDIKGLHRVHAFGFKHADRTGLLLAPSGRGKSALASLLCLKERGFSLFSDESPLLRRRSAELLPFPTRISIAPEVAEALELGPGELY